MKATFGGMPPRHLWVLSRTDGLGDLLLTLPMARFLATVRPDVRLAFWVRRYAAPILAHHEPPLETWLVEEPPPWHAAQVLIHVYPRFSLAWRAHRAGIPARVGTSRRWYHWLFCNHWPNVARRHSFLHEAHLNLLLVTPLLVPEERAFVEGLSWEALLDYRPRLRPHASLPPAMEKRLSEAPLRIGLQISGRGSAPYWPTSSWVALVEILRRRYPEALFVFTGRAQERCFIEPVTAHLPPERVLRSDGELSLDQLVTLISRLHVLFSIPTGPLHIAAALEVPTISVFPATAAMGPWRWRPLSPWAQVFHQEALCARCTAPQTCLCMARIEPLRLVEALPQALSMKSTQLRQEPQPGS